MLGHNPPGSSPKATLGQLKGSDTAAGAWSFEDILSNTTQSAPLTTFLNTRDTVQALSLWLRHFGDPTDLHDTSDIRRQIFSAIALIDHQINDQVNEILHHPKFQKLEASWRGLWFLAVQMDGIKLAKLRVLDITWQEVAKDIGRAMEFDQSQLFNKIYNDEYGTPGGEPYGVLIGDFEVSHQVSERHPTDDIATLEGLSQIAAAAFAPLITSASCELFGLDHFSDLRVPLNLQGVFAQTEYIRWRSMRNKPDMRFVGLTLPHILMRAPYRTQPGSYKGLFFFEKPAKNPEHSYLWGNAAYAFGSILIREFGAVGWFGHIRGVPRDHQAGGLVTNLATDYFQTDPNDVAPKPVTDVVITDSVERDISNLGLIPLCQCYGTPFVAFYSNPSLQAVKKQSSKDVEHNAKLSSMLQHVLCASRVAHYIKVMIRDKIGSFMTPGECENYLHEWLRRYATSNDDLDWESQARFPLREGSVQVREHPEKPGVYLCVMHLVPFYQADQMVSQLELVTELVQGVGAGR